jgi:hypothetical protein
MTDCKPSVRLQADDGKLQMFNDKYELVKDAELEYMRVRIGMGRYKASIRARTKHLYINGKLGESDKLTATVTDLFDLGKVPAFAKPAGTSRGWLPSLLPRARFTHQDGVTTLRGGCLFPLTALPQSKALVKPMARGTFLSSTFLESGGKIQLRMQVRGGPSLSPGSGTRIYPKYFPESRVNITPNEASVKGTAQAMIGGILQTNMKYTGRLTPDGIRIYGSASKNGKTIKTCGLNNGAVTTVTFDKDLHLNSIPALSKVPNINKLPHLTKGAVVAFARGEAALIPMVGDCLGKSADVIGRPVLPKDGGVVVSGTAYSMRKINADLDKMIPKGMRTFAVRGLIDTKKGKFNLQAGIEGSAKMESTTVGSINADSLNVALSSSKGALSVTMSGKGTAQVGTFGKFNARITGTMNKGMMALRAAGAVNVGKDTARVKFNIKKNLAGGHTAFASMYAPRLCIGDVISGGGSIGCVKKARVVMSNADIGNVKAGMSISGTSMKSPLPIGQTTGSSQMRAWVEIPKQGVVKDFVLHTAVANGITYSASIDKTETVDFVLDKPTVKTFSVNGKENSVITTSGSVSSGLFSASFSNVDIKVGARGFAMSGLATLSLSGKKSTVKPVPFTATIGGDSSLSGIREPEKLARRVAAATGATKKKAPISMNEALAEEETTLLQSDEPAKTIVSIEIGPIAKMPTTEVLKKVLGVAPIVAARTSTVAKSIKDATIHISTGDSTFKPGLTVIAMLKPSTLMTDELKQVMSVSTKAYLTCALRPASSGELSVDVDTPEGTTATLKRSKGLEILMAVQKVSATVSKTGVTTAVRGSMEMTSQLFTTTVRFPVVTLHVNSGGYTLVTESIASPHPVGTKKWNSFLKRLNTGINKIPRETLGGADDTKKRAIEFKVMEAKKVQPEALMHATLAIVNKNGETRAAVRSTVLSAKAALEGEWGEALKARPGGIVLTHLWEEVAKTGESSPIIMAAGLLGKKGLPLKLKTGAKISTVPEGSSATTAASLTTALKAVGVPLNFGTEKVDVTLSSGGMSFQTGAIKQKFGKDFLVTRLGVKVSAESDMLGHSKVGIELDGEYKGSKVAMLGRVGPGKITLTTRTGGWQNAFGARNVNLANSTFEILTDASTFNTAAGGVKAIKVLGKAEVLLQTGAIAGQAEGVIDMENSEKSNLLIKEHRADADAARFTVAHAGQSSQVQVALPLSKAALEQTASVAATAHNHQQTCDMLLELDSRLMKKQRPVSVRSIVGGVLDTAAKNPFEVQYNIDYFGKARTTSVAYSLAQMDDTANKGKYTTRKGYGTCAEGRLVGKAEIAVYKSMDDAQAACDKLKDCASVMWSEDHQQNYHSAWFCKDDMSQSLQAAADWSVASRTSASQTLLSRNDANSLMQEGIASHLPTAISSSFKDHAAKYGFEFSPTVQKKESSHWLALTVTPTKAGALAVKKAIKQAAADAVHDMDLKMEGTGEGSISTSAFEERLTTIEANIRDQAAAVSQKTQSSEEVAGELHLKKASFTSSTELRTAMQNAAAQVQTDAMALFHTARETIHAGLEAAAAPLKLCSNALQQRLPQLESLSVNEIYLECLYSKKTCDSSLVKAPQMEICFKGMGCKKGAAPRLEQMSSWIQSHAKAATTELLESVLQFKTTELTLPETVEGTTKEVTVGSHTSVMKFPSGIVKKTMRVRIPVGVQAAKLKAMQEEL